MAALKVLRQQNTNQTLVWPQLNLWSPGPIRISSNQVLVDIFMARFSLKCHEVTECKIQSSKKRSQRKLPLCDLICGTSSRQWVSFLWQAASVSFLSHLLAQASQASPDPIFVTNPPYVQTSLHDASLDRCPKSKWCIIFGVQNQNDASKSKCLIFAVLQPRYLAPPGCAGLIINISYWSGGVLKSKLNGSL